jgi:hypothetical protein
MQNREFGYRASVGGVFGGSSFPDSEDLFINAKIPGMTKHNPNPAAKPLTHQVPDGRLDERLNRSVTIAAIPTEMG